MKLSFSSAVRLSAGNSSIGKKSPVVFPGVKVFFAFYEASDRPEQKVEVTPQNINKVKNQIKALFRTKGRDVSAEIFSRIDMPVRPVQPLPRPHRGPVWKREIMMMVLAIAGVGNRRCLLP